MRISVKLVHGAIVNLNMAKTECVLFGTNQKTAKAETFEVDMNGYSISSAEK